MNSNFIRIGNSEWFSPFLSKLFVMWLLWFKKLILKRQTIMDLSLCWSQSLRSPLCFRLIYYPVLILYFLVPWFPNTDRDYWLFKGLAFSCRNKNDQIVVSLFNIKIKGLAQTFGEQSPLSPPVLNKSPIIQEKKSNGFTLYNVFNFKFFFVFYLYLLYLLFGCYNLKLVVI